MDPEIHILPAKSFSSERNKVFKLFLKLANFGAESDLSDDGLTVNDIGQPENNKKKEFL